MGACQLVIFFQLLMLFSHGPSFSFVPVFCYLPSMLYGRVCRGGEGRGVRRGMGRGIDISFFSRHHLRAEADACRLDDVGAHDGTA